jgi:pimeloyl-ACP methyl ester carboxylesterase
VLRFDDRGFGGSGGRETLTSATSADFADDVRSIVSWLKSRPDIDPARIYLIGHSEGGMIAPMVAAANPDIRAIVLLAGSAQTGRQILMYQHEQLLKAAGLPDRARDSIMATVPAQLDSLAKANAWMGFFMSHDPIATIKRVQQPVLIMQGETDQQVIPGQADLLAAALKSAGNANVTTRKFASVNHLFLSDPSGAPQGYATLSNKKLPKTVLGTIADWLATNAGTTPRVQRLF